MTIPFEVRDEGSVVALTPLTDAASEWLDANVQAESWQWLGNALVIDHRYAQDILDGIEEHFA